MKASSSSEGKSSGYEWTKTYEYWSKWKDPEEAPETKEDASESKLNENICGHTYDHQDEKEFYTKSEEEKLQICQHSFQLGSYFLAEGNTTEAIYYFRLVSLRYEYCFPESETDQETLDKLRLQSYQNLAFLYVQVDELRWAIDAASRLLDTDPEATPGYLYRAQAHRRLDEYHQAREDLNAAIKIDPNYREVLQELELLNKQQLLSLHMEKDMSSNMFKQTSS